MKLYELCDVVRDGTSDLEVWSECPREPICKCSRGNEFLALKIGKIADRKVLWINSSDGMILAVIEGEE